MTWVYGGVGLAVAGLAVLAVLAARVFAAARGLNAELERARGRLGPAVREIRVTAIAGDEPSAMRVRSGRESMSHALRI